VCVAVCVAVCVSELLSYDMSSVRRAVALSDCSNRRNDPFAHCTSWHHMYKAQTKQCMIAVACCTSSSSSSNSSGGSRSSSSSMLNGNDTLLLVIVTTVSYGLPAYSPLLITSGGI
jgi:hypothetical protein